MFEFLQRGGASFKDCAISDMNLNGNQLGIGNEGYFFVFSDGPYSFGTCMINVDRCNFQTTSQSQSGAFANIVNSMVTLTNCNFRNITLNTSSSDQKRNNGGALYFINDEAHNYTLEINQCDFLNCRVDNGNNGGAIYFSGTYFISIGTRFANCYAKQGGGAICLGSSFIRDSLIDRNMFSNNTVGTLGRDVYQMQSSTFTWNQNNVILTCGSTNTNNPTENLFVFFNSDITSIAFQQGCPDRVTYWRTDAQMGQDVENCGGNYMPCRNITNMLNTFGQSGFTLIPTGNATEQRLQVDDKDMKISLLNFNYHYLIQSHYSSQPGGYPYDRAVIYVRNGKLTLEQMRLICQATYDSDGPMVAVNGQGSLSINQCSFISQSGNQVHPAIYLHGTKQSNGNQISFTGYNYLQDFILSGGSLIRAENWTQFNLENVVISIQDQHSFAQLVDI
ncbi:MAG: hypothetical protein EZS28_011628 [Streblomastix strix]|uniref:Uncharacterized protein n=1 Tax=Streblomastix strix TaxID=222440 RepID=A0A5J4WEN8_9EUKA|nr:MAG: hypothetical protein EZS28_011628 [Streblomastix strix]